MSMQIWRKNVISRRSLREKLEMISYRLTNQHVAKALSKWRKMCEDIKRREFAIFKLEHIVEQKRRAALVRNRKMKKLQTISTWREMVSVHKTLRRTLRVWLQRRLQSQLSLSFRTWQHHYIEQLRNLGVRASHIEQQREQIIRHCILRENARRKRQKMSRKHSK